MERCGLRLDSLQEMIRIIELEDGHASELDTLLAGRLGIDDGLALVAALTHPEAAANVREAARLVEQLSFETR